jgi:hypothetical protein
MARAEALAFCSDRTASPVPPEFTWTIHNAHPTIKSKINKRFMGDFSQSSPVLRYNEFSRFLFRFRDLADHRSSGPSRPDGSRSPMHSAATDHDHSGRRTSFLAAFLAFLSSLKCIISGCSHVTREEVMLRNILFFIGCSVALALFFAASAPAAEFGSADEAKAMLERAVAAIKEDKSKALEMFNKGEGGFKDRDLYVFCANASDGILTAHPYGQKGKQLREILGKKGIR